MEAAVFAIVFVLLIAAYVYFSARVGLAEDAEWSRQHAITGHGVRLGLAVADQTARWTDLLAPPASEPRPVTVAQPGADRGPVGQSPNGPAVLVPDWSA
jgi:hypothetical protein